MRKRFNEELGYGRKMERVWRKVVKKVMKLGKKDLRSQAIGNKYN